MTAVAASGFTFVSWWQSCCFCGRARPWTQNVYDHDTEVKPEPATVVTELLMMGGKTPETCWAVNKRQDNKLKNCCIWLVTYLNCTMMHGLTNLTFTNDRYWFQTSAVFWMLYYFFWVIPRRLSFPYRRFGTHCSIFMGRLNKKNTTNHHSYNASAAI
jgi:hypothetical protein